MSRYTNIHGEQMNRVEIAEMDAADDAHDRKHEKPQISTYMETSSGKSLGIDFGDVKVLVQPQSKAAQKRAGDLAGSIADNEVVLGSLRAQVKDRDQDIARMQARIDQLQSRLSHQCVINEAAIAGKRRFFSAVLMVPKTPDDWSGEVWLMDPVKQMKGNALRFASLAEVRAEHPELWVTAIAMTVNGERGVLLDAWGGK